MSLPKLPIPFSLPNKDRQNGYLLVIFLMNFTKATFPAFAPRLNLFTIVTSAGILMVPQPIQTIQGILKIQYSMLAGIAVATIVWILDRFLRSVEFAVEQSGSDQKRAQPPA